jgi:hypothetical protein
MCDRTQDVAVMSMIVFTRRNMKKLALCSSMLSIWVAISSSRAQPFNPPKEVRLTCSPLPYVFDCSISRMPNPQFTSRCFYVAGGQSTLMRADHRMGFSNEIVGLKVDAGMAVTGIVTDNQTGKQASCEEDGE